MHLCPACHVVLVPFWICDECWKKEFGILSHGTLCEICWTARVPEPCQLCDSCWAKEWAEVDAAVKSLRNCGMDLDVDTVLRVWRLGRSRPNLLLEGTIPCKGCKQPTNPENGELCAGCRRLLPKVREWVERQKKPKRKLPRPES
jgi:hypothetical protein